MNEKTNVVPFRPRPPSSAELEVYARMTRNWSPELKQRMFPEHYAHELKKREPL